MYSDEQWLPCVPPVADSDLLWLQYSYLESDFGLHDYPPWSTSHGYYDTASSWTPDESTEACADNNNEQHGQAMGSAAITSETKATKSNSGNGDLGQSQTLQWNDAMTSTAHSDFFGLDIGLGYEPLLELSNDMLVRARENLRLWTDVSSKPPSPRKGSAHSPDSASSKGLKTPGTSILVGSRCSFSGPSKTPSPSKVQKTFHFVENSDKKTATRLRNTMTSRNLRQSKLSRIAELEKELERQQQETEKWRQRAIQVGWIGDLQ